MMNTVDQSDFFDFYPLPPRSSLPKVCAGGCGTVGVERAYCSSCEDKVWKRIRTEENNGGAKAAAKGPVAKRA